MDHAQHAQETSGAVAAAGDSIFDFFSQSGFMPHGHCYLWKPGLVWTHVVSDTLIGLAYFAISVILYVLMRKVRLGFSAVILCFGVFIGACGITHLVEVWTLWYPDYWMAGFVKAVTAFASVGTGVYLYRLRGPITSVAVAARESEQRRLNLESLAKSLEERVEERTAQLEASSRDFRAFFELSASGAKTVDVNTLRFLRVNRKLCEITGYSEDELLQMTVLDLLAVEEREREKKRYAQLLAEPTRDLTLEKQIVTKSGEKRWIQVTTAVVRDQDGKALYTAATVLDVTQPKEAVQKLEKSEKELERRSGTLFGVLNATQESIWLFDRLGRVVLVNRTGLERIKLTLEQVVGKTMSEFLSPAVADLRQAKLDEVFQSQREVQFEDERAGIHFLHSFSPVFDDRGAVVQVVSFSRAISERKKWENALAESEQKFRALANFIPQLAWITDPTGSIVWYNQRWYDFTGTTLEEMQGWGWQKVHHPDHGDRVNAKWTKHLQTGEFWEDTFPLRKADGEYRWFLSRAFPLRNESGEITQWFGTNTDVTDQREAEASLKESKGTAERANAAKTQFLANMSHEIRTPIGAIMGFTELLRSPTVPEADRTNYMTIIERNSRQLLRLIDDILDLSKVEAGKMAIENIEFSLVELLADLASVMHLRASEKGIAFNMEFAGKIPDRACSDPTRIKQILANVIGNAIKFTDRGRVTFHVRYENRVLDFEVSDTGPGMTREQQARLFTPFEQADPSMTRRYGGTGLGLVLSKRLAEALGGDLTLVSSEKGAGSKFLARVSVDETKESQLVGIEALGLGSSVVVERNESDRPLLKGLKVLVVEDSPDNQFLVQAYLKGTGAELKMAENGRVGCETALAEKPDIVLMDIQMPEMDGHQATKTLRSQGFSKPIIALTAHAMREERDRCFESGCTDYLTKPLKRDTLLEVLARYR